MKEIGGYLQLGGLIHHEYYPRLTALNTARNALVYICRARGVRKLWLPYFLCDSVEGVCRREKIELAFYPIAEDFQPAFDGKLAKDEYLYIVNYYGQLSAECLLRYKKRYDRVIVDNVQAFFTPPLDGVDTIYSCRKFFGVPDGAYLACDAPTLPLEMDASGERMTHILGRLESADASAYYAAFKANDASFRSLPLRAMSKLTHTLLGAIDYDAARARREENWRSLDAALGEKNRLYPVMSAGPYMYPFYAPNGMTLKKRLAENKIYVPTLWPNVLELDGCEQEKDFAANILPLPIDQRYGAEDMQRVAEEVRHLLG